MQGLQSPLVVSQPLLGDPDTGEYPPKTPGRARWKMTVDIQDLLLWTHRPSGYTIRLGPLKEPHEIDGSSWFRTLQRAMVADGFREMMS